MGCLKVSEVFLSEPQEMRLAGRKHLDITKHTAKHNIYKSDSDNVGLVGGVKSFCRWSYYCDIQRE